ncbi:hypothetical protein IHE45_17G052000 [Dioscorea alata]|uniref:Uncharacterized protein n=1 Tax=Dioscorea alata TaxID=55571 RepID=A0ACB7UCF0_DIOAL|nr:hypothetical protein IHE45_17G052000 [Dioscorea alata]
MMKTVWSYAKDWLRSNKDPHLRTRGSYKFIANDAFRGMNVLARVGWLCMDFDHMVYEAISHSIRRSSMNIDYELSVSILKGVTRPTSEFVDLIGKIRYNFAVVKVEIMLVCEKFTSAAHRLACLVAFMRNSQYWKDIFNF